jgi:patatin-related protein
MASVMPAAAPFAATANSPAFGALRELRLALVCYGGVSLAIYMHGVTKEIHKLLLASAAYDREPDANPFPDSLSEHFYWSLLRRMHQGDVGRSTGVKTRVVVDVISGTSAGGINGVCLGKAVARNRSQEALKTLWFERGDIKELAAAWKFLPLAVKGPWLVLKSAVTGTTPLRGDDMCRWLYKAFSDMDGADSSYPAPTTLLPPDHTLDLFVTTTDFQGYPRELPIYDPRIVTDVAHRHVLEFHHETRDTSDFGPAANHVLAFAARATSSFPGAFPPITFAEYRKAFEKDPNPPDLATLAAPQFRIYAVNGVDPRGSAFVDGGVLNNAPFALATRAFKGKPAAFEVVRRLLYIEPDPVRQGEKPAEPMAGVEKVAEVPAWLGTIWSGLSTIPAAQPVLDDLNNLAERNRVVRRIRDIIETNFETIRGHVAAAIRDAGIDPASMGIAVDGTTLLRVRALVAASAEREAGYALGTYRRLRLRLVMKRFAAMIAGNLGFPPDTYPARYIESVASDWAGEARLLNQIEKDTRVTEDGPDQVKFLTEVDLDYEARRIQFVIAAFSWWYGKVGEAGFPTRTELDQAKERLYDYLAKLEALVPEIATGAGRATLERAFPADEVRAAARRQDRDYAIRHRADLDELRRVVGEAVHAHVARTEAELHGALTRLSATWKAEVRFDLLVRYLGFPFWDILVFPVQALVDVNERDHVEVVRVSPYDATLLEADGAKKLKGSGLHHFEAFFKREYRENDYLWGRLDAAERLVGLLLEDPKAPGIPADKRECWSIFDAIIKEERPALQTIVETVKDLAARVEGLRSNPQTRA